MQNGLHIHYSAVNKAYFVMWFGSVLKVCPTEAEAKDWVKDWS